MEKFPKKIELLAPVGRWEVLGQVLENGADAVYLAGKEYNMRRHRSDFNFNRDEMARASEKVHACGAKLYIAVNSLLSDAEMGEIEEYLNFLQSIAVDAIIVQDLGLIQLVKRRGIKLNLHASTMMNIHSPQGAIAASELAIQRIICSRDVTLAQVQAMQRESGLEMEYFIHGDMCITQSGQCYTSGILFGKSSNRGKCMKPCRWPYEIINLKTGDIIKSTMQGSYLLAIKDFSLFAFIPELVDAGVSSLKLEGRMRPPEFIAMLVRTYRRAIDHYLADPLGYVYDIEAFETLYRNRVREFSTCQALKKPDAGLIGSSGTREPLFLSTAGKDSAIDLLNTTKEFTFAEADNIANLQPQQPQLVVHVGNPAAADEALQKGADWIYIGGELSPLRAQQWGFAILQETISRAHAKDKRVGLLTPRATLPRQLKELAHFFEQLDAVRPDAVLVHNLGTLRVVNRLLDIPVFADFSFNVLNRSALDLLKNQGASQATLSLEASFSTLKSMATGAPLPVECIVHGPIPGMYLEHCLLSMYLLGNSAHDPCRGPCRYLQCGLSDKLKHVYPIEVDQYCRSHILLSRDLACLPYLDYFCRAGVSSLRIEGQYYDKKLVGIVTELYSAHMSNTAAKDTDFEKVKLLIAMSPRGFTLGAYPNGIFKGSLKQPGISGLTCRSVSEESEDTGIPQIRLAGS